MSYSLYHNDLTHSRVLENIDHRECGESENNFRHPKSPVTSRRYLIKWNVFLDSLFIRKKAYLFLHVL